MTAVTVTSTAATALTRVVSRRRAPNDVMTERGPGTNLPWGTIVKPDFPLGYQKLSQDEVNEVVDRLNKLPEQKEPETKRPNKDMTQEEINEMLQRLTKVPKDIPDSDRRIAMSIYKNMGVVSSYAWQGY